MYCVEAYMKASDLTQERFNELTKEVPLFDLIEVSSSFNSTNSTGRIAADFVSQESAEDFAKFLRNKGQPAVVYEEKTT